MAKKSNTQEFIDKAQNLDKHGDRYDYSLVDYVDAKTKVIIICKEHGEFLQAPESHLRRHGCPRCGNKGTVLIKRASSNFESKSRIIHSNKYDYSLVKYINNATKVKIVCKEHGEFHQKPNIHLTGHGCPCCGDINKSTVKIEKASLKFEPKARIVHSDKYDYSKVLYVGNQEQVIIICKEHGEFLQKPNTHLNGCGCPECANAKNSTVQIEKASSEFEPRSRIIHSDKYDYSKVVYVGTHNKVKIICKIHGEFRQQPNKHLDGNGCPCCGKEKRSHNFLNLYETNKELGSEPGMFYLLKFKHASGFEFIKAGITKRSIQTRYYGKQYNDFTYKIIEEQHLTNLESAQKEQEFIKENKEYKFDFPKDIKFEGRTETFNLDVLEHINP